jgi:hypothetical protein
MLFVGASPTSHSKRLSVEEVFVFWVWRSENLHK